MLRLQLFAIFMAIASSWMPLLADEPFSIAIGKGLARPQQPQLAIDDSNTIHIAFGAAFRAWHAAIPPGKSSHIEAKPLPASGVMSLGMRRGPRIAATKSGVCITLIAGELGKGKDGDIHAFQSKDLGAGWTSPAKVNDISGSAREGLHAMATSPDGRIACAWLDLRNKKSEVMMSLSTDGGATWSKNAIVYQSPDGAVCPCCHPSLAFGARGEIHVMWRNALGGARDMYLATSTDEGITFSKAKKLGQGTWKLDACPMDGGMFCVDAKGKLSTIWRRENKLFLYEPERSEPEISEPEISEPKISEPKSDERGLGIGEQPWIASTTKGPVAVWVTKRGGALNLQKPGETALMTLDKSAADPVIAASPDGKTYAVAWERRESDKTTILMQSFHLK